MFVNKGFSGALEPSPSHHIFVPFFGGADGQAALRLAMQLVENAEVTVTRTRYQLKGKDTVTDETVSTKGILEDKIRISTLGERSDDTVFVAAQRALPDALRQRVTFRTSISYDPVQDAVADATTQVGQRENTSGDLVILGRSTAMFDEQMSCLGLVAGCMLERDVKASIVGMQAKREPIGPMIATIR